MIQTLITAQGHSPAIWIPARCYHVTRLYNASGITIEREDGFYFWEILQHLDSVIGVAYVLLLAYISAGHPNIRNSERSTQSHLDIPSHLYSENNTSQSHSILTYATKRRFFNKCLDEIYIAHAYSK